MEVFDRLIIRLRNSQKRARHARFGRPVGRFNHAKNRVQCFSNNQLTLTLVALQTLQSERAEF